MHSIPYNYLVFSTPKLADSLGGATRDMHGTGCAGLGICIWVACPCLHGHDYGNDVIMLMSEDGQEHATQPKSPVKGG